MPAPSPDTNPSRSASNGREARAGSSFRVDIAFIAQNPPMVSGTMMASAPAGDHHVGVAPLDDPEGVADRVVAGRAGGHHGGVRPLGPKRMESWPGRHVDDQHRDEERARPGPGPFSRSTLCHSRSVGMPPMPEPMSTPKRVGSTWPEVDRGVLHRLHAGGDRVLEEEVELLRAPSSRCTLSGSKPLTSPAIRVEALGVEPRDGPDARPPLQMARQNSGACCPRA